MKRPFLLLPLLTCVFATFAMAQDAGNAGTIVLKRAVAAPVMAQGTASLDLAGSQGTSTLSLELQGLIPELYDVRIVLDPDDPPVIVGTVSIVDPELGPDRKTGDTRKEDSVAHASDLVASRIQLQLPPMLDVRNASAILVTDLEATCSWREKLT
jgi:hypothetical protein